MAIGYQTNQAGEYIGKFDLDVSPLEEDVFLVPAGAYVDEPPEAGAHEAVFRRDSGWVVVPDWRGLVYWLADGSRHSIDEADVLPPEGALLQEPEYQPTWADLQASALAELKVNDMVFIRCGKAGVAYPDSYKDHDEALRAIVREPTGDPSVGLPVRPPHPVGS